MEGTICSLVMPLMNSALDEFLKERKGSLSWHVIGLLQLLTIAKLARGVAEGMQYLHHANLLHRDLKSLNVLVDDDWTPKLIDFGLAR